MSNKVVRQLFVALAAVVVLVLVAFGPSVVAFFTKKQPSPPALATAAVTSFPVVAKAAGTLFPQQLMYVNFSVAGQLSQLSVKVGDTVTAGQRLAQLDTSAQQAALASAQAALASAEAALAAAQAARNAQQVAAAQSQIASAQAQLQKAQSDLSNAVLTAPVAGTVLQVNSAVGETVSAGVTRVPALAGSSNGIIDPTVATNNAAGTAFIVLGSAGAYQVSAAFDQASAAQLSVGQTGTVSFDALPGLTIPGTVAAIASSATQVNGVPEYYASMTLTGSDPRLRSGMTVTVTVDVAQATNVLSVPNQALYTLNNATYVDVWYKGSAVPTAVTTGLIGDKFAQVTSGLIAGQQVVTSPAQGLPSVRPSPS